MKPKFHKKILKKGECTLDIISVKYKNKFKIPSNFTINKIKENRCYKLWSKYLKACEQFKLPKILLLYHLTKTSNVESICKNGFNINMSKIRAFGKGVNLASNIMHLKNYYNMHKNKNGSVSIIVCQVCVKNYHENFSDFTDKKFIKKFGYSKPLYITPKKGYDSMYAVKKNIWIIPSSSRIYPSYVIEGRFII
jgi:hypothetical protein